MAKKTEPIYPKVIVNKTKVKSYARTKGGKLVLTLGKLQFGDKYCKEADQLVDNQAEVKVTIESTEGLLPGTQ